MYYPKILSAKEILKIIYTFLVSYFSATNKFQHGDSTKFLILVTINN
jgi:hypothetical protein